MSCPKISVVDKKKKGGEEGWVEKQMTYLIVSEGVTAKMASTIPAPSPAKRLRGALTFTLEPGPTREPIDRDHAVLTTMVGGNERLTSLSASARLNLS